MKKLYWIFPCYNEEECLPFTSKSILAHFSELVSQKVISEDSRIVFVDDGSKDNTWSLIEELAKEPAVIGLRLSRNKGHQFALEAGLRYAYEKKAEITITMDVDLQDDIEAAKTMIEECEKGFDVVYGVRNDRKSDSFLKRFTAEGFYALMKGMGVELVPDAGEFRLLTYRVLEGLLQYEESNLFLRGIVPQVGYPASTVGFKRKEREQGKTHYPFRKMFDLAMDGMTSFSNKPLSWISKIGMILSALSVLAMIVFGILNGVGVLPFSIYYYLFPFISLMTGIVLLCLSIIGLYVGKIAIESRKRPHYFIRDIVGE